MLFAYISPDVAMPVASVVAAVVGVIGMIGLAPFRFVARRWRSLRKKIRH